MFEKVNVPVLGVIENMAYMIAPESKERIQMFPKGELDQYLEAKHLKKIGQLPFNPSISMASESGIPLMESYPDSEEGLVFKEIARQVIEKLNS
jgi:ATP-binding protein involved in chromosome partitioning